MAGADRLIEVFTEAKARPAGAERDHFLAEACLNEPGLKEQVLSLLQADDGAGDFLKNPIPSPTGLLTEKPGDRIGRYKLLQQIGEGGCGVVCMAEQEEPVRRCVALKVIKLGMDTKQVVARFEAERQALALMDHPNIAKVFDAGATDTGRPYFVMELVRGIKITSYCDENNLSTTERLVLFIQVCQAIQHAHQKGIIHRDLKPSNILVAQHDTVAVPKIIDFGIAKATNAQPLTDKTVFTAFEQFIGTPAYMSPEQAQLSGLDIDTRTDIYSLGVLLYELLTGQTPFDPEQLLKSGVEAMRRTIREKEPARPSTRLTQELVAADIRRRTSKSEIRNPKSETDGASSRRLLQVKELVHSIRGDLDWIVMKCLEKDRTRRYETANGLAMDLQRHLNNEPVVARPPSAAYRFSKFARRNKAAVATAATVVLAILLTAAGLAVSTIRIAHEQRTTANALQAEKQERLRADAEKTAAQRHLYVANMNLAQQAWEQVKVSFPSRMAAWGTSKVTGSNGDGTFTKAGGIVVNDGGDSAVVAWGDYDNDGSLDLFVGNVGAANFLYHNNGNTNHWIKFRLVGTRSNRAAIGAKVRVRATINGQTFWQLREISGGDGFRGQNSLHVHVGLGNATNADLVRIEWPSGTVQELSNFASKQFLTVTEPGGEPQLAATQENRQMQLTLTGKQGYRYAIETSTALTNWTSAALTVTVTNQSGALVFPAPGATNDAQRFYRAVWQ